MADGGEGAALPPGVLHTCSIGPKAEGTVLKAGLLAISEALGSEGLLDFPRRPNGTPMLMRQGFFERILKGEVLLNDCSAADASAAEADVKRLGLKQLLAIRCKNLDFLPTAAKKMGGKASFLNLVDRCTTAALTERLLAGEALPDAHRAQVVRHAVLIYGASRELAGKENGSGTSDWWLLAIAGTRRYLRLSSCEVSGSPPNVPVYCYRSYTAKDPRDPKRERIFRWHVELVQDATKWTEDPLDTEQQPSQRKKLTDGPKDALKPPETPSKVPAGAPAPEPDSPPNREGFSLFGDFDVEDLFDEFDNGAAAGSPPQKASETTGKAVVAPDIDDFFDSLLAETLDDTGPPAQKPAAAAEVARDNASSVQSESAVETATPAPTSIEFSPPSRSAASGGATSIRDGGGDGSGGGRGATASEATGTAASTEAEEEVPPRDAAEARLRTALERFYHERKTKDKLSNVAKIAQKYSGDRVVELWAMLSTKYSLPAFSAVQWLAGTLPPLLAVQWPTGQAPAMGLQALEAAQAASAGAGPDDDGARERELRTEALRAALKAGDLDAISALAFHGCPEPKLRPQLWRALLGFADEGQGGEASGLQQRREAYRELKERATAAANSAAAPADAKGEESDAEGNLAALRSEVEVDAKAAWRGDEFITRQEVLDAVMSIVLTHAWKRSYVRGMCDIAALLLYVMADGSTKLAEAEADSFWCFSTLMAEVQDGMAAEASTADQTKRVIVLLRTYDSPVAELLAAAGLSAMPTLRLGGALCTRGGFSLNDCASLWDIMLADPRRFELCDYIVVALMILNRGEFLQLNDVGGLAETLLAAPRQTKVDVLMNYTYAICAFERRCAPGSALVFPPRLQASDVLDGGYGVGAQGPTLDNVVQVAQTQLSSMSSWWGKALEAGRSAAREAVSQAGEMLTEERVQHWKTTAQAVASAASAAGTAAAEKTAAAAAAAASASKEAAAAAREKTAAAAAAAASASKEAAAAASAAAAAAAEKIAALDADQEQDEEKVMFEAGKEDGNASPPSAKKPTTEAAATAPEPSPPSPATTATSAAQPSAPAVAAPSTSEEKASGPSAGSAEVDDIARQLAELEASMEDKEKAASAGQPPAADDEVPQLVSADEVPKLVAMPPQ